MAQTPTLKQLKYLCQVAEHKHFGHAASACNVSQSTLSSGIAELEEILGVTLIERQHKRLLLTAIGEDIVRRSQHILTQVEDLIETVDSAKEPFSSKLRLGVIPTIAPFLLPELLKTLRSLYPKIQLFIREDLSESLIAALHQGQLDVLLLALPYPAEGVETEHLFYDNFILAYESGNDIAKVRKLTTNDLKHRDLLLLEDGHCLRDHALDACKLRTDEFHVPYQATSLTTIVQMVAGGIGMTLLPEMAIKANILSGTGVKTKKFSEKEVWRSIGLMWRKKSPRKAEFSQLSELIHQHFSPPKK